MCHIKMFIWVSNPGDSFLLIEGCQSTDSAISKLFLQLKKQKGLGGNTFCFDLHPAANFLAPSTSGTYVCLATTFLD